MEKYPKVILVVFLFHVICGDGIRRSTEEVEPKPQKIHLEGYDKDLRPSLTTVVTVNSFILDDLRYDDRSSIFEIFGKLALEWDDPRLAMNDSEYDDVFREQISVSPRKVWTPDITVQNGVTPEDMQLSKDFPVVVSKDGNVFWHIPKKFRVRCPGDLTLWPRDGRKCRIQLESWSHDGYQIELGLSEFFSKEGLEIPHREQSDGSRTFTSEWDLRNSQVKKNKKFYTCCSEPYIDVTIDVVIQRNATAYEKLIHVSSTCLSFLTLVLFLLPPTVGEKMTFGGICLILNLVLTAFTYSVIGHSPSHMPLIVDLLCTQLKYLVCSVFFSAVVIRAGSGPHSCRLPRVFVKILRVMSRVLCLFGYRYEEEEEEEEKEENNGRVMKAPEASKMESVPDPKTTSAGTSVYPGIPMPPGVELHPLQPQPHHPSAPDHPASGSLPNYYHPIATSAPPLDGSTPGAVGVADSQPTPSLRRETKLLEQGRDWLLLAATVDRLAFLVYLFACVGFLARYYSAPLLLQYEEMLSGDTGVFDN